MLLKNFERYIKDETLIQLLGPDLIIPISFILNKATIRKFCRKYYSDNIPRIVICGECPGPHNPGKTGVPFIDSLLAPLQLPMVSCLECERLEEFYLKVLQQFGTESFFKNFYITNISSVMFTLKYDNESISFNKLPAPIMEIIEQNFLLEMAIIQPTHVICLGDHV